jgi:hypothetical protein
VTGGGIGSHSPVRVMRAVIEARQRHPERCQLTPQFPFDFAQRLLRKRPCATPD